MYRKENETSVYRIRHGLTIRKKLTILLGLHIVTLLVWYASVLSIQRQETIRAGIHGNEQLALKMYNLMENHTETLSSVSAFPVLRDSNGIATDIYKHFSTNPYESDFPYQIVRAFTNTVTGILDINQSVSQVAVVNMAGKGFLMERNVMWGNSVMISVDMAQPWVTDTLTRRGTASGILPLSAQALGYHGAEGQLYCARAIINAEQVQPVGLTVVGIPTAGIDTFFEMNRNDPAQIYQILDAQGQPIAGLPEVLALPQPDGGGMRTTTETLLGAAYVVSLIPQAETGLRVLVATPERALYQAITTYTVILYVMIAFVIAAFVVLSGVIVQSIRKPINGLIATIDAYAEGDFSAKAEAASRDELGQIADALNHMSTRVSTLIHENYEQQLEKKVLELQALKAQVNPHFLYNSLESARMQAYHNHDNAVAESLLLLSDILRYGLVSSDEPASLAMEMENVRRFVTLSNLRYHGVFSLIMSVEEACKACPLPRVTLQPLVENSIRHGFAKGADGGTITVFGYTDDGDCVIRVHDDGCGVSSSRLEALTRILRGEADGRGETAGIGLYNVHRRLQLMFGDTYGLRLLSVEGKGFAVEMRIPLRQKEET